MISLKKPEKQKRLSLELHSFKKNKFLTETVLELKTLDTKAKFNILFIFCLLGLSMGELF